MIIFTVHEPQHPAQGIEERAGDLVFVKEGFTLWGFIFGPLWLLYNRAWLAFLITLGVMAILTALLNGAGLGYQTPLIVDLLVSFIIGFEGNDILRWTLERKRYSFLATVTGRNRLECERRFFDAWLPHIAGKGGSAGTPLMSVRGGNSWSSGTTDTWPGALA